MFLCMYLNDVIYLLKMVIQFFLCSDISKISADVVIKKIKAPDPHAYVQNTILYNKVYVNAFAETAPPHLTKVGEVWEVEADFIIKVRS